jgi:hypothetical protein
MLPYNRLEKSFLLPVMQAQTRISQKTKALFSSNQGLLCDVLACAQRTTYCGSGFGSGELGLASGDGGAGAGAEAGAASGAGRVAL